MIDERRGWTSASNAEYDLLCPGRHQMQQKVPEEAEKGEDADFGTRVHDALSGKLPLEQLTLPERETYDLCTRICNEKVQEFFGANWERARLFSEQRYWMKQDGLEHSGRCDRVYRLEHQALVIDFKALHGDTEQSPRNLQVRDQVVLVRHHFLIQGTIGAAIVQPRVSMKPLIAVYTQDDVNMSQVEMWQRVRKSNQPAAPLNAGVRQCKFCRAKEICHAYAGFIGGEVMKHEKIRLLPFKEWSAEQCVEFMNVSPLIARWIQESVKHIKERLAENPVSIPGLRLKEGNTIRTVNDPQELFNRAAKLGLKLEDYLACVKVGNEDFRKAMSEATGKRGKELDVIIDQLREGIVNLKQNEPSVEVIKK